MSLTKRQLIQIIARMNDIKLTETEIETIGNNQTKEVLYKDYRNTQIHNVVELVKHA